MDELTAAEFDRVLPLFQDFSYQRPAVFTVLEGTQAGRVFVDRREQPAMALIWSDAFYLAGRATDKAANAALVHFLRSEAMPRYEHLLLYSSSDAWRDALDHLLRGHDIRRVQRTIFDWDPTLFLARHVNWRARVPDGMAIQHLDATTAPRVGGIVELWGSVDHFLDKGFGFCALQGEDMASSCQTVFVGDRTAETGVGTQEPHRRQGLATLVACAYLEHCLAHDIRPVWGCYYNPASENLAHKLGFVNKREVEVTYVHTPPAPASA